MQTDKRYATLILQSLLDQKQSSSVSTCQIQSKLQDKLNLLETNYSKMEAEYFKKIRDLKNTLIQRTRKQNALNSEVAFLREEFKNHQQEISKITQEIANEKGRSNEPKHQKKNSSPGLLKKSLESEKKIDKRMSPTTHGSVNTNIKINKNEITVNSEETVKAKEPRKGYSPTNNIKKITQIFPQNNKQQHQYQAAKNKDSAKPYKLSNADRSPEGETKKVNHSPKAIANKNNELKGILINSLKNFDKEKPSIPNASPKRILRKSPGTAASKPQKKMLGNLKESLMQAF